MGECCENFVERGGAEVGEGSGEGSRADGGEVYRKAAKVAKGRGGGL